MHGTIAQDAYDAPPHYRKLDSLLVTDNWQDIIDGGYLIPEVCGDGRCNDAEICFDCPSDCGVCPDTTPPAAPTGVMVN